VAPESCVAAVEHANRTIHWLVIKVRDRRLKDSLKSFTDESRACQQASPEAASVGTE
jgi:hypothetical protein